MAADERTLSGQVRSGLRWSLLNTALGRLGTFASGIALARLLDPKQFGVFAVALLVMTLLLSLNDAGASACVVRWQGEIEEISGTGTTLTVIMSLGLFAVMYAITPYFTAAVHTPTATGVVRLMCVGVS